MKAEENFNNMYEYIENFKKLGFGLFVHFGLYSVIGRGEWYYLQYGPDQIEYESTISKFKINKNWAENLVRTAKEAGCRYITLTTRHHDGFSLYDTCGLTEFDAPHSSAGRDLIREFVDECNKEGVIPFFYHTLLDWHNPNYNNDFPKYIDYEDRLKGKMPEDICIAFIQKYTDEQKRLETEIAESETKLSETNNTIQSADEFIRNVKKYLEAPELTREMC